VNPLIYLLCNVGYLIAGFVIGRLTRTVEQLAANKIVVVDASKGAAVERRRPRIRLRVQHYVAFFLVALGIFTAVQSWRQSACMQDYANFFADALDARSTSSSSAQEANDQLWETIGRLMTGSQTGPDARQKFEAALQDFLTKRSAAKEQQRLNPYPPPPRDLCK